MTTTPSVPVPGEDGLLRERLVHVLRERWLDDESERGRATPEGLADAVLPLVGEREASLRAEVERLGDDRTALGQAQRRTRAALLPILTEHPVTREAVQAPGVLTGYVAERAAELLRWYAVEVERLETLVLEKHQAAEDWRNAAIAERDGALASRAVSPDADGLRLPDDAHAQIAQCLEDYWTGLRDDGRRTVYDETAAGQAHEVLALVRSWAPSTTETAPGPADGQQCRAIEGGMGVDCYLSAGHDGWHAARHETGGDVGYPFAIQWPRNEYDRCSPAASQDTAETAASCNGSGVVEDWDAPADQWNHRGEMDTTGEPPGKPCDGCANCRPSGGDAEDAVLLAVAEDRARRDNGARHPLAEVEAELAGGDAAHPVATGEGE